MTRTNCIRRDFSLNTTFFQLANWLERRVTARDPATTITRRTGERGHILDIRIAGRGLPDISFEAIPVSADRVAVVATCHSERHAGVFEELLAEIARFWPEARPVDRAGSQNGERGMNLGTPERVARALLLREKRDVGVATACQLAGVDYRTFRRWMDDPVVRGKLDELRDEGAEP
jgi:hypothetical protein